MSKAALDYILPFVVGSAGALGGVAAWDLFGPIAQGELVWLLGVAAFVLAAAAALHFYPDEVARLTGMTWHRPADVIPRSGAGATKLLLREPVEVNAARDELERQLGKLIVLIAGQLQNSKDHVASLKDANAHLASVTTVTEIREVIRSLITKNQTTEHQTRDLDGRLKAAQDQASALRTRLRQAEKLAALDPLTSVANRRRFEQFISSEIERSHARGTPLCLIMADIDHFKKVNDKHGHSAGDKVLKAFADLLTRSVRGGDLVARYGGEEFAVVLPQTPMGDAFRIAERIRRTFETNGGPDEAIVAELGRLTASFGVAEIREGEPPSALIQRADQMLYEAKDKGRNTTMIWSSSSPVPDSL
jgi:diguanylate cyclase